MAVPPGTSLFLGLVSGSSAVLMDTVNTSSTILPKPSPDPKTTNITLITTSTTPAAATATVLATTTTATTTKFHTTSSPSSQMTYPTMYSSPPSPHTAHLQRDNPLALTTPVYTQKPAASTSNVPALSNTPIPNNHNNDPLVTLDIEEDSENYSGSKEHSDFGQNPVSAHMSPKAPAISDLSTPSGAVASDSLSSSVSLSSPHFGDKANFRTSSTNTSNPPSFHVDSSCPPTRMPKNLQNSHRKSHHYPVDKIRSGETKDGHHLHLQQLLSRAVRLSPSSVSPWTPKCEKQRRMSDIITHPPTSYWQSPSCKLQPSVVSQGLSRERKRNDWHIVSLLLPRFMSKREGCAQSRETNSEAHQHWEMDGKRTDASEVLLIPKVASNDHLTPFSIQSSSVAISMTNSDINVYSGQKSEQDGDTRNENDKKSRFFRVGRSHGVGSSVGAKFLLNPLLLMRRGSSQMQSQEMPSPSNTDIMESLGEMRPYHDSRDSERSDHYKRLGLQDVRHTTSTDEDIAVNITRQQNDNTTRKNAMSPTAVLDISFDHEVTYDSITAQGSPIDSNIPTLTPAAIARPTSRLGRLGRFKFPSISMGGIQRSKGSGGSNPADTMPDPVQLNIRRGSLSALMVKPFRDVSVRYAAMHFSNSASTIATANTPAMTILGQITPGSDSYSSISSSHNGLDASSSANKKSWQSLSGLSDANAHHPHHSSKAVPSMYMTSNQQPSAVMSNERSFAVVKDAEHHNTIPQNHRSGMNNIFGSERFTSSSSGSHGQVYGPKTSIKSGHGPQHAHGSSRRTVSASQIFPNSISGLDGVDKNTPSASQEGYQSSVCYFQSERGIEQAGSGKEIEPRKTELERAQSEEERSVGRYLFGNELSNMSFGETGTFSKATIVSANMVEKSTNTRAVFKFPAASASMDKLSASTKPGASFPSTAQDSNPASNQLNSETRRKSDSSLLNITGSSISASSGTVLESRVPMSPVRRYFQEATIASGSGLSLRNVTGAKSALTISTKGSSSSTSVSSVPLSPLAIANARLNRKHNISLGEYKFPPSSSGTSVSQSSIPPKPKYSMAGLSNNSSIPSIYTLNSGASSSTTTSALNLAMSLPCTSAATPNMCFGSKTNSTASGRNPDIRHLEPRSAVADYTPTIHYKRQRSMSLQDADLLTADQFITLMPDDVSPKRRFSSEETVPENAWYGNSRRKNVPQPDPAATLRSLLSALQVKCGLVIQHLDAVSVSVSVSPAKDVGADIITEAIGTNMATHQKTFQNNSKEVDVAAKPSGGSAVSAQGTEGKPELQYGNQSLNKDNRALVDVVRKGRPPDQARVLENDQNAKERREDTSGRNYKAQDTDIRTDMDAVDSKKDLVESIITLFDEVDYAMNQMVEIMTKCISTEQLSSLSKELDSMCFLAQQVLHVETDGDRMSEGQSVGREESDNCSAAKANAAEGEKELRFSRTSLDQGLTTAGMDTASTPEIIGGTGRLEVGHVKNDSVDQTRLDATQPQHRPQYRQQSQDIKSKGAAGGSGTMQEIQKETVKNYVQRILLTAESCVSDYMKTYNRMFVLPASGYKIEGCNDLRKIEHALRQEQPPLKLVSIPIAATGTPERSLLSQASAVRTSRIAAGEEVIAGTSANTDNEETALAASLSTVNFIGHSMDHVKSLPKCKEIGGSTGMAGTISLVCPAGINMAGSSGSIGTATTGPAMTSAPVPGISMLGDYSREHMGHEAYYYRNWFLGKEHRTFVGQVEGLGTVIISIIKDMVVPTEARPSTPGRLAPSSSTMVTSNSASSFVPSEAIYPTVHMRPEIARSTNSFYPGRGQHLGSGGGSLISSSRSSSEAMRVILPASTAVVPGAGRKDCSTLVNGSTPQAGATIASNSQRIPTSNATSPTPTILSIQASSYNNNSHVNLNSVSTNHSTAPPRWQYRCILRQKDVDSLRITLPEPEPSPLNNLARRVGKPQWKTILQSIHPAITQQAASKLKKVQTNPHFERELAKFDETMLRFNYKFGVLLVHPGQTKEEQWFDNQMASSTRFQEFLESGVLGQKVTLKGFERFSAGLDTRLGEAGEYSYYDTWGEGFEIMYHVSTLLPHNNDDKQQIQRKRHIGNDIVCIVFVDGEQPFIPNAIKSQFLHIFVVIHLISLPDGTKGYAATIACDDQVPEFGPPLPDPPIFRTPQELRAFLLCKMINGENAAYKAPRLIKPHQRARSGMLESLVAKANCLTKERDSDKKLARQQKAMAATTLGTPVQSTTTSPATSTPPFSQPSMSNIPVSSTPSSNAASPCQTYSYYNSHRHECSSCHNQHIHHCLYERDRYLCRSMTAPASSCAIANDEKQQQHLHGTLKTGSTPGLRSSPRNSLVTLGSETAASIFRARRRDSNAEGSLAGFRAKEKEQQVSEGDSPYSLSLCQQRDRIFEGPKYIETLVSPTTSLPLPIKTPKSAPALRTLSSQSDTPRYGEQFHASGQCDYMCYSHCSNCSYRQNACGCTESSGCSMNCSSLSSMYLPMMTTGRPNENTLLRHEAPHPYDNGPMAQRTIYGTPSPSEMAFAMNRNGVSHLDYPQVRSSFGDIERATPTMVEKKDSDDVLGMSIHNSKGRSKSELDLLLITIQEGFKETSPKKLAAATQGVRTVSSPSHSRGISGPYETQHHHALPSGTPPTPQANVSTIPVNAAPPHSSMKGRAHNFLTTLVRRRASSNDTSALGPTVHLGSKAPSSTLGSWSEDCSSGDPCTYHQHCHYVQHQHHHPQCHHQCQYSRQRMNTGPSRYPPQKENSTPVPSQEPLKFKEGYILRNKTPIQINTSVAIVSRNSCPHQSQPSFVPPSATAVSPLSSSSLYTASPLPLAPLRSSTGTSSAFNGTTTSPHSLKRFSSRDALGRVSLSSDRRPSVEALAPPEATSSTPPASAISTCRDGNQCAKHIEVLAGAREGNYAATSSRPTTLSSIATLSSNMVGRSAGIVDVSDQAGWRFSESPSAYTPMSLRPTNSQSSLGSASALGSTPTTASAAVMTQTVSMNKTDYLNYKPIPPSRDQFMQWQRQSGTYSAQTSTGPVSNASTAVKDVREYLSMEQLALCESQPLMAIENELGPSDTFTSIPSSASAATTAAAADGWHAEDMDTLSTGVINSCSDGMSMDTSKVVKRAVSAESFLGRAGKFARMASLHPRVVGLEESLAILQRPVLSDEFVRSRGSDFELGKVVEGPVSLVISVEEKQISDSTGEDVEAGEIGRCKD